MLCKRSANLTNSTRISREVANNSFRKFSTCRLSADCNSNLESFVTPSDDTSLNDNATGTSNANAPGAHRFKIALTLAKKEMKNYFGLSGLKICAKATKIPLIAIGGINISDVNSILKLKIHGVAMISSLLKGNIKKNCMDVSKIISSYEKI